MGNYNNVGKQVLFENDLHIADAGSEEMAHFLAAAATQFRIVDSYIENAVTTLSPSWHGDKVAKYHFMRVLNDCIHAANELDKIKKTLFYGRDNNLDSREGQASLAELPDKLGNDNANPSIIIHGIIGAFTEAGELLEAMKAWFNNPEAGFDPINMREEIGDQLWYQAILLNEAAKEGEGYDFPNTMRINIAKLQSRFPDKFGADYANNRNLDKERSILEDKAEFKYDMVVDEFADGDIERPKSPDSPEYSGLAIDPKPAPLLKPTQPASGEKAVERAAESARKAFDAVANVSAPDRPEIPTGDPELAKGAGERLAPMLNEKLAQENNPKK